MIQNINKNGSTVSADLHGFMYSAVYGYSGVLDIGSKMEASVVSNNEIKITDGLLCNHGRFMRIVGSESVAIKNGTSGIKRTDLIVAHFETDGMNETHDIRVITGESGGATPSYAADNIYDAGTACDLPLYAVKLNGLNIESVDKMFGIICSIDTLRSNISDSLNELDTRIRVVRLCSNASVSEWHQGNMMQSIDVTTVLNNARLSGYTCMGVYCDKSGMTGYLDGNTLMVTYANAAAVTENMPLYSSVTAYGWFVKTDKIEYPSVV